MLSKSKYIKALQCEKRLWLDKHQPHLKDDLSEDQKARFNTGHRVGELAQLVFPGGKDASAGVDLDKNFAQWMFNTNQFIEEGETIIYEAAFNPGGAFAAMDILIKESKGWSAIEVKSSTSVKDYVINDAAIQYYILTQADIHLVDIEIMYLNNEYIRGKELDIKALFKRESVLERILPLLSEIPSQMKHFKEVLKSKTVPDVKIGPHCSAPFECEFMGQCWKHIPDENNVFSIGSMRGKEWDLVEKGIYELKDIPDDYPLSEKQRNHLNLMESGKEIFDKVAIMNFLNEWTFPLFFFDFETIGAGIPIFEGARPYQQVPFQYSLHIMNEAGSELIHKEFLADPSGDPRLDLVKRLIRDLGTRGTIVTWNMSFEKGKIADLAEDFPEYAEALLSIYERVVDLMIPFKEQWYYTPEMMNSASIKKVLPALVPDLSYDDLEIQDGGNASQTFLDMLEGKFDGDEEKALQNLKEYCKLDTLAMVKIYRVILSKLKST